MACCWITSRVTTETACGTSRSGVSVLVALVMRNFGFEAVTVMRSEMVPRSRVTATSSRSAGTGTITAGRLRNWTVSVARCAGALSKTNCPFSSVMTVRSPRVTRASRMTWPEASVTRPRRVREVAAARAAGMRMRMRIERERRRMGLL